MASRRLSKTALLASALAPAATVAAIVFAPDPVGPPPNMGPHTHGRLAGGHASGAREPHQDHEPKHGGMLFMAADGFHHLEGVLRDPTEFRLYLYDDFTEPISAAAFLGAAEAEVASLANRSLPSIRQPLAGAVDAAYLWMSVPEEMTLPLQISLRLTFPGRSQPDSFDFVFD